VLRTQKARPYKALSFGGPDNFHFAVQGHVVFQLPLRMSHIGEIVHEDDLLEQVGRGSVQHRVHRPEEYRPRLIVETDDN